MHFRWVAQAVLAKAVVWLEALLGIFGVVTHTTMSLISVRACTRQNGHMRILADSNAARDQGQATWTGLFQ